MFDLLTTKKMGYYVYALIDPRDNKPFYIGKGKGNRVFEHVEIAIKDQKESDKLDKIREIRKSGNRTRHIIIRHGLSEDDSFLVESSIIDFMRYFSNQLTNEVFGHDTSEFGVKTADEIIRRYNAEPLKKLEHDCVIININKTYEKAKGGVSIYEATHEAWVISERKRNILEYALSEYRGVIVGVYKINDWYQTNIGFSGKKKISNRWGFNGEEADDIIKSIYINKSIKHTKKRGAANPIKYKL